MPHSHRHRSSSSKIHQLLVVSSAAAALVAGLLTCWSLQLVVSLSILSRVASAAVETSLATSLSSTSDQRNFNHPPIKIMSDSHNTNNNTDNHSISLSSCNTINEQGQKRPNEDPSINNDKPRKSNKGKDDIDIHSSSTNNINGQQQQQQQHHQQPIVTNTQRIHSILHKETRGYNLHSPTNIPKRTDYLSWNDYFMAVAYLSAQRSKDPHPTKNSRHGACIVDTMGRIVGIGYDGFPRGCSDDCLPWASSSSSSSSNQQQPQLPLLHTKDPYLCHAEINAILNKCSSDVIGGRMYVPNFPCNECAKFIIQSGIREVLFVEDKEEDSDSSRASRILFEVSGVKVTKFVPSVPFVRIDFGNDVGASTATAEDVGVYCTQCKKVNESNNNHNHADNNNQQLQQQQKSHQNQDEMVKYLGLTTREASYDPFQPSTVKKRSDYLTWDDYFMGVAFLSAQRSKDPNTQVGACIVDIHKCIIGIGYNGFPRGCSDDHLPWARTSDEWLHKKYPYVVHAEVNAILNKCSASVRGATIYVALFPCNECAKVIIQSGIGEVVYLNDFYHDSEGCRASRIMFSMAGVRLRHYRPGCGEVLIDFGC